MRRGLALFALGALFGVLSAAIPARAALDAPTFAAAADSYLESLGKAPAPAGTAADFLAQVAEAESRGNVAAAVAAYEGLVTVQPKSFRAWLQLAASWRKLDANTGQALGAAYQANRVAGNKSEDFESLLMIAGVLRDRLDRAKIGFNQARQRIDTIALVAKSTGVDLDAAGPGSADLLAARTEALRESLVAADRVSAVLGDLDLVYNSLLNDPVLSTAVNTEALDAAIAELDTSVFAVATLGDAAPSDDEESGPAYDIKVETLGDFSRACVRFTLPLLKPSTPEFDTFSRFLDLTDTESGSRVDLGSLQVENDRLCLLRLQPGHDYTLAIKDGLPAQNGATLKEPAEIAFTVEDRPATVGFRGSSFILPRQGDGEVPLYTVNQDTVPLALLRVTDRNLYRHIALGHVGNRMPQEEYRQMRDLFSDELWQGSIAIQHEPNKLTTSYVPLLQILEGRRNWIGRGLPPGTPGEQTKSAEELIGGSLKGTYLADTVTFQSDANFDKEAGVYALVTEGAEDEDDPDRSDEDRCITYCAGHYVVQWIVRTDIGLAFYETEDNFHVVARSLKSGGPVAGLAVQLVAANNRVLASGESDANGVAAFPRRLTEGTRGNRLAVVLAESGDDFSFIDFGTDRLDLSKLGVFGRSKPGELDAYLYTDRGIYRPGNSVSLTALIRSSSGQLPPAMPPITLSLISGGAVLDQKLVSADEWLAGGTTTSLLVPETARLGTAEIRASVGDDRHVIGTAVVQIDHFRPDRARLDFQDKKDWAAEVATGNTVKVSGTAAASYLFGDPRVSGQARAARLRSDVEVRLSPASSPVSGCYEGYAFARFDEASPSFMQSTVTGITDANGLLAFTSPPMTLPETRQPLQADVSITLYDNAGPVASKTDSIGLAYARDWIGVAREPRLQPAAADGAFGLAFDVIGISGAGQPLGGRTLTYELFAERNVFVWQRRQTVWTSATDVVRTPVSQDWPAERKTVTLDGTAGGAGCLNPNGRIAVELPLGTYVLEVTDKQTGDVVSVRFTTGSNTAENRDPEPDMLGVVGSAKRYAPGDTARIDISAPFDGEVLVALADDEIREWKQATTTNRGATIEFTIPEAWAGKGLYALATVFRREADGTVAHGPARAMGATYFDVTGGEAIFDLKVSALGNQPPDKPMPVSVCVATGGACVDHFADRGFVSLYAVDEGLINLTAHPAADPFTHFFGKLALPVSVMDNYGRILLHETTTGQGGDRPSRLALSNYTSDRIVAEVLGPIPLVDGKAQFEVPPLDLDTTVRLVAIAWTDKGVAADTLPVTVRGPIVARLDAPRFFTPGDKPLIPLLLVNRELGTSDAQNGDPYRVRIGVPAGVTLVDLLGGDGKPLPAVEPGVFDVRLKKSEPVLTYVSVEVATDVASEDAEMTLSVTPPAGVTVPAVQRVANVPIRPPLPATVETVNLELKPGEPALAFADAIADEAAHYQPGLKVQARLAAGSPIAIAGLAPDPADPPNLLDQLVWTGMVMANQPIPAEGAGERIAALRKIVADIQALQAPDGSFLPYRTTGEFTDVERGYSDDRYLVFRAAMVLDFFNTVSGRYAASPGRTNIRVGALAERRTVEYLTKRLDSYGCEPDRVYAAMVLIPFDRVRMEDIQDFHSDCGENNAQYRTPLGKAMLAALFNQFGQHDYRDAMLVSFKDEKSQPEEHTSARLAMTLSFLVQSGASEETLKQVFADLHEFGVPTGIDLQQQAWQSRAGGLVAQQDGGSGEGPQIEVSPADFLGSGSDRKTTIVTPFLDYGAFASSGLKIRNVGQQPVAAAIALQGVRADDGGGGAFAITRRIFDPAGREIGDGTGDIQIGDNLLVIVEGRRTAERPVADQNVSDTIGDESDAIVIADLLPGALEIVQPNAFATGVVRPGYFPRGLTKVGDLRSVEAGDDRLIAVVEPVQPAEGDVDEEGNEIAGTDTDIGPPVDFRIAYYARVVSAGDFVLPPTLAESVSPPVATSRTALGRLKVNRPTP